MKYTTDRSLGYDIVKILAVMGAIIGVIVVSISIVTEQVIDSQKLLIIDQKQIAAGALANRFEHRLEDAGKVLQIAARSTEFSGQPYSYVPTSEFMGIPPELEQEKKTVVRNILAEYENFETLAFILPNGDVYFVEPYESQISLPRLNFADREWYKGTLETGETYIADPLISAATGSKSVPISSPVYGNDGTLYGMLLAGVNLARLEQELVEELDLANNNRVIYIDNNANVIQDISASKSTNRGSIESIDYLDGVSAVLAGEVGYTVATLDSKETLIVYHPIRMGIEEWGILSVQPTEDAFSPLDLFRRESYILMILLSGVIGAAGFFLIIFRKHSGIAKQLYHANVELVEKDKLKDEFLKIASHELRTPIQPIIGYSSLGVRGLLRDNEGWQVVHSEAQKLMRLANNIIDISLVQSGAMSYNMEESHIADLIRKAVDSYRQMAKEKRLSLELVIDEKFDRLDLMVDAARITRVFEELLDNALKFTDRGRIQVECTVPPDKLLVQFSDSGTSIPDDLLQRIFETFSSVSVNDAKIQGAGLGLFLCKAIISAHGGTIEARNKPDGAGVVFKITLSLQLLRQEVRSPAAATN